MTVAGTLDRRDRTRISALDDVLGKIIGPMTDTRLRLSPGESQRFADDGARRVTNRR
jgi:hypothetical protein